MYLGESSDQEKKLNASRNLGKEKKKENMINRLRITLRLHVHPFYIAGEKRAISSNILKYNYFEQIILYLVKVTYKQHTYVCTAEI